MTSTVHGPAPRTSAAAPLVLVCTIVLLEASLSSALTPLIPHYVRELGLGDRQVGVLVACYTLGMAVGAPGGAWLVGRLGVRTTSQAALLLLAVTCTLFGLSTSVPAMDLSRLLGGVAGGCIWATGLIWVMSGTPEARRGAAIGAAFGAGVAGTLVGPLIGTAALAVGVPPVFAGLAVFALVLVALVSRRPAPAPLPSGRAVPIGRTLRDAGVRTGGWLMTLVALGYGAVYVVVPLRMEHLGAADWQVALVFLLTAATAAVTAPVMGRAADRHGPRRPAGVALCLSVPSLLFLAVPPSVALLGTLMVLGIGGAFSTVSTAGATLLSRSAERAGMGLAGISVMINLCYSLSQTSASFVSALIIAVAPDAVPLWLVAAAGAVTAVALMTRRRREDQSS